jgi:hypothetical protein
MFSVSYPGVVYDQTTGDDGIGIIHRLFDDLSSARDFCDNYCREYPEFIDLCHISPR